MTEGAVVSLKKFVESLEELEGYAKTARKNGFKISSHSHYSSKAGRAITSIRRHFLSLCQSVQAAPGSEMASLLESVERGIGALDLAMAPSDMLFAIGRIRSTAEADLEVKLGTSSAGLGSVPPFLPPEIIPDGTYRRVLEEVNECFRAKCFNAVAAMLRRLIESLIIEAFEAQGIEARIQKEGDYCELKTLIGRACSDLKLGRNTREALPKMKFFGDLSVHSRRNLVRKQDLERLHSDARVAVEELASHLPK